jgi:hypothetical protein
MKITYFYHITAKNNDVQWNWNGFEFEKTGRGDSTTIECDTSDWHAALKIFHDQFSPESHAKLILEKVTFDDETEEFEFLEVKSVKA